MAGKIPVTVITGFLGSGKTTLIREMLKNNQGRRIAVLVNEFGELGIDGELLRSCQVCDGNELPTTNINGNELPTTNIDGNELPTTNINGNELLATNIIELTNGCLCCTVQEEFLPTMQEILKRRDSLDCILIETSGLALPKPLIQAFRWPEIRTGATVDGVITVVDCEAVSNGTLASDLNALNTQRQADPNLDHETPIEELFEDQLACADLVLLTKVDRVDEETKTQVQSWLKEQLQPAVKIVACEKGEINPELLLGFNASVEDNLDARPSHHDEEEEHEHDEDINSVHFVFNRTFEPQALVAKLKDLVKQFEIYRIKGFVAVPNKQMRLVLQGVGDRIEYFYDRPWQTNEPRETRLVSIGRALDKTKIESVLLGV